MILPSDQRDRHNLFANTIRECLQSQDRRRSYYRRLRQLFLHGAEGNQFVHQNKLREWGATSSAYCFAPEFAKFGATLPKRYGDQWIEELDAIRDETVDLFSQSGLDMTYGLAVDWAHPLPCMFIKVITSDGKVCPELIEDPADVGVWEENLPFDKQEALVHTFTMNLHAVIRLISQSVTNAEDKDRLIRLARELATQGPSGGALAPATPNLLLLSTGSSFLDGATGAVRNMTTMNLAQPEVMADVVPMAELWIKDDLAYPRCGKCERREGDDVHHGALKEHNFDPDGHHEWEWRKVLAMGRWGDEPLWEALNPLLRQRHPIRQLCLEPVTNYAFGLSPMELMINLQLWGEQLLGKHDLLLDLQLDPPIAIIGLSNVDGERAKLLRSPGGTFVMPNLPNADIKRFAPETPPDTAGMHQLIDQKFHRAGGLPLGADGTPADPNMRTAGQMTAGAALTSPRTNRRAMRVEDSLEEVMTDTLRLHRRMSKDPLRVPLNEPDPETGKNYRQFLLSQVPGELRVRVSAHSASPLFRNEMRELAVIAKREGAIGLEAFLEMLGVPMLDTLKPKARQIEKSGGEVKKRALASREQEAQAKLLQAQVKVQKEANPRATAPGTATRGPAS